MYGFLMRVGGIDDPLPFDTYLEAVELSRAYLQRRLAYASDQEASEDEAHAVVTVVGREREPVPPLKPIMNTSEVAAYLGKLKPKYPATLNRNGWQLKTEICNPRGLLRRGRATHEGRRTDIILAEDATLPMPQGLHQSGLPFMLPR
jgi:hypothetical protein